MNLTLLIASAALLAATYVSLRRRSHHRRTTLTRRTAPGIARLQQELRLGRLAARPVPAFADHIARMPDLLPIETLRTLRAAAVHSLQIQRSLIPGHKKGGTVSHDTLREHAPAVIAFYESAALRTLVSHVVGEPVVPTPPHDQSSCSILVYDRPGDHIGWHYDHNFYRARHFTVLLSLENRRLDGAGCSSSNLETRSPDGVRQIPTDANTLVIFEGARVLHRATRLGRDERRLLLSMTFCTDPRTSAIKDFARRIKDIAYYGPRALWN